MGAMDSAASQLRRQLGESTASLERFQIPVAQATTSSLEALRAFTQEGESFEYGDMKAAQVSASERDTVKVLIDRPLVRALLAVEAHKPGEAVELMEPARRTSCAIIAYPICAPRRRRSGAGLTRRRPITG